MIANEIYETLDLSDIDVYVPGARRDHIKVTNEDAPRDRSCLQRLWSWFWLDNTTTTPATKEKKQQ